MANALFAKAKDKVWKPGTLGTTSGDSIDWTDDNIKAVLVDHGTDNPDVAVDEFLSDIAAGARVATSGNLTGKTFTLGVADCDDIAFGNVSGASCESVVIYKDTGTASTSPLIAKIDTATGLPVTPSGGPITLLVDNGANKLFAV